MLLVGNQAGQTVPFFGSASPPRRRAYTVMELLLVLTLLVVLTAIIYPSAVAMYSDVRLTQAADVVRAAWAGARSHAIDEGQPYRFAVVPNTGNYRVAPDQLAYWSRIGVAPPAGDPANPPLVRSDALPTGMRFSATAAPPAPGERPTGPSSLPPASITPEMWSTKAIFLPDGTARDDIEVVFGSGHGARELIVSLRALTGAVTVRWSRGEGSRP